MQHRQAGGELIIQQVLVEALADASPMKVSISLRSLCKPPGDARHQRSGRTRQAHKPLDNCTFCTRWLEFVHQAEEGSPTPRAANWMNSVSSRSSNRFRARQVLGSRLLAPAPIS